MVVLTPEPLPTMPLIELTDENLDTSRRRGERADAGPESPRAAIDELLSQAPADASRQAAAIRALWQQMLKGPVTTAACGQAFPNAIELPAYLNFSRHKALPTWYDKERVKQGQLFFGAWGPQIILGLLFASLPTSYACGRGAQVIYMTGRLETDTRRRIFETAGFVMDVMNPGSLDPAWTPPKGEQRLNGIESCRQVRLMHATLRELVRRTAADPSLAGRGQRSRLRPWRRGVPAGVVWSPEDPEEVPINQEDLAGTLVDFALVPMRLFEGDPAFDFDDAEAYIEAWSVVGWLIGIEEGLIPRNYAEMDELGRRILQRHLVPSEAGTRLCQALLRIVEHEIPGRWFDTAARDGMLAAVSKIDPGIPYALDLEGTVRGRLMLRAARAALEFFCIQEAMRVGRSAFGADWGFDILNGLINWDRGYDRQPFSIPGTLQESWEMAGLRPTRFTRQAWSETHMDSGPRMRRLQLEEAVGNQASRAMAAE